MAVPLAYNLRNLFARKVSTTLTALGIGLVSWVFIFTLALAGGFQSALQKTGSHENAIVVRRIAQALNRGRVADEEHEAPGAQPRPKRFLGRGEGRNRERRGGKQPFAARRVHGSEAA